jgi:hypothetical protein
MKKLWLGLSLLALVTLATVASASRGGDSCPIGCCDKTHCAK